MTPNGYVLEQNYTTKNQLWPGREQDTNGIVIHSIGVPQERADVLVNNFNRPGRAASVHCFIEPGRVVETFPTRIAKGRAARCGHVGSGRNGSWNNSRLGLEMCEPRTIRYTGAGAQFVDNDPAHTRDYCERVIDTTARYVADLCVWHGWSVENICGHLNASRLGWGSASGDPNHLWDHIGYTMEQFRRDVTKYMKGDFLANMTEERFNEILNSRLPRMFRFIEDVPNWGRPHIQKMVDNGYLSGSGMENGRRVLNIDENLTRTFVIMSRTGMFDGKCPDEDAATPAPAPAATPKPAVGTPVKPTATPKS